MDACLGESFNDTYGAAGAQSESCFKTEITDSGMESAAIGGTGA